jgi:KDEL-tailed cysteine endopeptidase
LVDCSIENGGCNGGNINLAFEYIIKNGICSSLSYPYIGVKQTCNLCNPIFKLNGYIDIPSGNESAIFEQLKFGPVSVAIEADQLYFMFYSSGVFDGPCGNNVNHGVTIVGYGYEPSIDLDYWIVKNSWGLSWGEDGYIRVIRDVNICGIALFASRPY